MRRGQARAAVNPWAAYADLLAGMLGAMLLVLLAALVGQARLAEAHQTAAAELEALRMERAALEERLAQDLEALIAAGLVDLNDGVVAIRGSLLFESASAEVSSTGRTLLAQALPALSAWAGEGAILVSGHTDDVPVVAGRFASNWELSTARATEVVTVLTDAGFPPEHLIAAGFGEHRPVAGNTTVEGRAENRRVELARVAVP